MQAILKPTSLSEREIVTRMHKVRKYGVLYVRCWLRNSYGRKTVRKIYKQICKQTNGIFKCICTTKHGAKDPYIVFVLAWVQTTPWVTSVRRPFSQACDRRLFFYLPFKILLIQVGLPRILPSSLICQFFFALCWIFEQYKLGDVLTPEKQPLHY